MTPKTNFTIEVSTLYHKNSTTTTKLGPFQLQASEPINAPTSEFKEKPVSMHDFFAM